MDYKQYNKENPDDTIAPDSEVIFKVVIGSFIALFGICFIAAVALIFSIIFFPHALDKPPTTIQPTPELSIPHAV